MRKFFLALPLVGALTCSAFGQIVGTLPFTLQNGNIADANQVMANFNAIVAAVNNNAATAGANSNITALLGLTTPLTYTSGGSSLYIGGTSSNVSNAYTITSPTPTGFTLTVGKIVSFIINAANTGPTTLAVNGLAATNFFRQTTSGPQAMLGGEMQANQVALAYYDGTEFQCLNCANSALVPSCTSLDYAGTVIPSGYLNENGAAVSRTTFSTLFNCLAYTSVSATTNSNTTVNITGANTFIQVGWYIGGTNVTCNSYVTAVAANSITINAAAGATGATTLTIGPYQQGDCSTTFNVPNYVGKVLAGVDGTTNITTAQCPNAASIGDKTVTPNTGCGAQQITLLNTMLPASIPITDPGHTHALSGGSQIGTLAGNISSGATSAPNGVATLSIQSNTTGITVNPASGGGGTVKTPTLPPVSLVYKIIKT